MHICRQGLGFHCPFKGFSFSEPKWVVPPTLLTPGAFLPQASDRFGGAYPLLAAGSTCPVFHLPDPHPQALEPFVSASTLAGVDVSTLQSSLVSNCIKQVMDVARSSL